MSKALQVWEIIWPKSIPAEDYERAILMAQLVKEPERGKREAPAEKSHKKVDSKKLHLPDLPTEGVVNVIETAAYLSVSTPTVYEWIKKGRLKAVKRGGQYAVDVAEIRAKLESKKP